MAGAHNSTIVVKGRNTSFAERQTALKRRETEVGPRFLRITPFPPKASFCNSSQAPITVPGCALQGAHVCSGSDAGHPQAPPSPVAPQHETDARPLRLLLNSYKTISVYISAGTRRDVTGFDSDSCLISVSRDVMKTQNKANFVPLQSASDNNISTFRISRNGSEKNHRSG